MPAIRIWMKLFLWLIISCCCFSHALAINQNKLSDPVLTLITGLTVNSSPGEIRITNTSGKDIAVSSMLLSFSLDQTSISSMWGTPWLNWRSANALTPMTFQFTNQINLPNNSFAAGSSIVTQYSPSPWDNPAVATNVQLFNVSYPLSPTPITSSVVYSGGITTITITNISDKSISLAGAQLRMTYQGQFLSSVWGTPWANWSVGGIAPNYVLSAGTSNEIPVNGIVTVAFQSNGSPIANIALWVMNGKSTPITGQITLNFPATPQGATANPTVTLKGPSFPQGQNIIGTWGQPYLQKNLQIGTYTFSAPNITTPNAIYLPTFTPNPVTVSGDNVMVNLMYSVKLLGKLFIQIPSSPAVGVLAPTLSLTGPDFPSQTNFATSWGNVIQICANGSTSCAGISTGNYNLTIPYVYSDTDAFAPTGYVNPIVINANQVLTIPLAYTPVPQGRFSVTINMPSASKTKAKASKSVHVQTFAVTFTNLAGKVFTKNLLAGTNTVSLPINDTYLITAPNVAGLIATVTPATLTVNQTGTPPVTITYALGSSTKFVVYYGGWGGIAFNLMSLPTNVTAVNLAFANITSNLQVDTSVSGWLTNIPAPNVRLQPTYFNWTTYKYNHPNTKILLSVGGSTFSAIWNSILTPTTADAIARNIATVVNQPYPAYRSDISTPADFLGNVFIDGVDLDVETGGRKSAQVINNVILLVNNLKQYLNANKIITYAAFSVGSDPNNSQCTVPSSIHCGEDITLLQSIGSILEWVNLMAYDAGQEYAKTLYKTALANVALYVPKNKVLLGLDIQTQWPGFNETAQDLAVKAAWQKQNGYGGSMFWGVGVQNNPAQEQQFVNAIAAALN